LQPGATQAVRVQYTGPAGIETEQAFRIIAEQLPVDFTDGQDGRSGIKMLFRYEGSVYVRPPRAAADIRLTESSRRFDGDQFEGVLLRFENRGTAHAVLNDLRVEIIRRDAEGTELDRIELSGDDLPVTGGTNLLAGRALEEMVELSAEWSQGQIEVQYDVDLVE
jgi:fimbrial chaperone protein